ncbi:MAG: hypothetical protein ABSG91_01530 [Syntrophobacteraceae bacterium]|jgi:hypothetical protein
MSLLQYIKPEDFYVPVKPSSYGTGQFCRIIVPIIEKIPSILDIQRDSPTEHSLTAFKVRKAGQHTDFRRVLPLKYLNLRSNEELLIQRSKYRPGVIMNPRLDFDPDLFKLLRNRSKTHLLEDSLFVAPCYSVQADDFDTGVPLEMSERVKCLLYSQFFYCAANYTFRQTEGILRFDRIQVVVGRHPAAIQPLPYALSEEAFSIFRAMFLFCITGEQDEDLKILRELLKDSYLSALAAHAHP